jgi:hypothetical protein
MHMALTLTGALVFGLVMIVLCCIAFEFRMPRGPGGGRGR